MVIHVKIYCKGKNFAEFLSQINNGLANALNMLPRWRLYHWKNVYRRERFFHGHRDIPDNKGGRSGLVYLVADEARMGTDMWSMKPDAVIER